MDQNTVLPVFVTPTAIQFPVDDTKGHNQTFTLFNPYEFSVKFKILSTAPSKYKINTTHGVINAKHYVDMMIRHLAVSVNEIGSTDFLRIELTRDGEVIGVKDLQLTVVKQCKRTTEPAMFRSFPSPSSSHSDISVRGRQKRVTFVPGSPDSRPQIQQQENRLLNASLLFFLIICSVTIAVPAFNENITEAQPHEGFFASLLPVTHRPTISQQLLAAFTLGVSITILFYQNLRI